MLNFYIFRNFLRRRSRSKKSESAEKIVSLVLLAGANVTNVNESKSDEA